MTAPPSDPRRVTIVGGGVGGLTAALSFARHGWHVTVLERAPELREIGAGIQISPNGAAVLDRLGLSPELDRLGIRARAVVPMDGLRGARLAEFDLTHASRPYRFLHRADLIDILTRACTGAGVGVRTGSRVLHGDITGRLALEDGTEPRADLVLGADGLNSVLRATLNSASQPFFTGQVAWRAIVPAEAVPAEARIWMLPRRHVVTYPLRGGRLNIVAVREQGTWAPESWDHEDDPAHLRAAFTDAAPELRDLLARVTETRLWGLFRHEVAPNWHRGRLALLGDAAHPTLPFLAQGANLAIEDAWVLSDCLGGNEGLDAALGRYQELRRDRVIRAVRTAEANARNYHLSGLPRMVAHAGLRLLGRTAPDRFVRRLDWLYEHDVTRDLGSRVTG